MLFSTLTGRADAPSAGLFAGSRPSAGGGGGGSGSGGGGGGSGSGSNSNAGNRGYSGGLGGTGGSGSAAPSRVPQSRITVPGPPRTQPQTIVVPNVRAGIFGTALEEEDEMMMNNGRDLDDQVAPTMNGFGAGRGFGGGVSAGAGGIAGADPAPRKDVTFQVWCNMAWDNVVW